MRKNSKKYPKSFSFLSIFFLAVPVLALFQYFFKLPGFLNLYYNSKLIIQENEARIHNIELNCLHTLKSQRIRSENFIELEKLKLEQLFNRTNAKSEQLVDEIIRLDTENRILNDRESRKKQEYAIQKSTEEHLRSQLAELDMKYKFEINQLKDQITEFKLKLNQKERQYQTSFLPENILKSNIFNNGKFLDNSVEQEADNELLQVLNDMNKPKSACENIILDFNQNRAGDYLHIFVVNSARECKEKCVLVTECKQWVYSKVEIKCTLYAEYRQTFKDECCISGSICG